MIDSALMRTLRRSRALAIVACSVPLALAAGCGDDDGGGDTGSPEDAARAYVEASNQRDFEQLCDVLGDSYKLRLRIGDDCPAFLREQSSGDPRASLRLVRVEESGGAAVATLNGTVPAQEGKTATGEIQLKLQQDGGDWKVTGIGGNVNIQQ
jgi:hypothetical protein